MALPHLLDQCAPARKKPHQSHDGPDDPHATPGNPQPVSHAADIWGLTLLYSRLLMLGSSHRGTSEGQDVDPVQCRQYGRGALHCVPALQAAIPVIDLGIVGTARLTLGS